MKKFFVEAEVEVISISALDDVMAMASANGDVGSKGWGSDDTIVDDSNWKN